MLNVCQFLARGLRFSPLMKLATATRVKHSLVQHNAVSTRDPVILAKKHPRDGEGCPLILAWFPSTIITCQISN